MRERCNPKMSNLQKSNVQSPMSNVQCPKCPKSNVRGSASPKSNVQSPTSADQRSMLGDGHWTLDIGLWTSEHREQARWERRLMCQPATRMAPAQGGPDV